MSHTQTLINTLKKSSHLKRKEHPSLYSSKLRKSILGAKLAIFSVATNCSFIIPAVSLLGLPDGLSSLIHQIVFIACVDVKQEFY